MVLMNARIKIDAAGRVVLPKALRDEMQLEAGATLELESEGDRITLRPVRSEPTLRKELGIWVYSGEATDASIPDLIDRERAGRLRDVLP